MTDTDTRRPWYVVKRDRKVHGIVWMTDDQILARLERGEQWAPLHGEQALIATIQAELPCDGSGVRLTGDRVTALCALCDGLGCPQ